MSAPMQSSTQMTQPQPSVVMVTCPKCQSEVGQGTKFCPNCGASMVPAMVTCSQCGTKAPAGTKFCPECGQKLSHESQTASSSYPAKRLGSSKSLMPIQAPSM